MTATYRIFPDAQLKHVIVSGHTELSELRDLANRFFEDPQFSTKLRQLIDLSELTDAKARFIDVFSLRNFYLRKYGTPPSPVPVAIVAPTDLGYGISKMFATLMTGQQAMSISIFRDHTAAFDALALSPQERSRLLDPKG